MTVELNQKFADTDYSDLDEEEMAGGISGAVGANLITYLNFYVKQNKLGRVFNADTDFELNDIGKRRPDVAFCSFDSLPENTQRAIPVPPDLAVEVVSDTDRINLSDLKLLEYQQAGVKLIWVVRTILQVVEVYRANGQKSLLGIEDTLEGETVIPGFSLPVKALFE